MLLHADTDTTSREHVLLAARERPNSPLGRAFVLPVKQPKIQKAKAKRSLPAPHDSAAAVSSSSASLRGVWGALPRSREVGQSWITSAAMTAYASFYAIGYVFYYRPRLLLLNGPGTCVPVALAAWLARLLGVADTGIVFVESAARVGQLSMTGKILYYSVADRVLVQWKGLTKIYRTTEYCGLVA